MSDAMEKILSAKRELRKQLASLPYEQKVKMVRRMRARNQRIASNPLRQPFIHSVTVSGARVDSISVGEKIREWTLLACHQSPDQSRIPQTSAKSVVSLLRRNGMWSLTDLAESGQISGPPCWAGLAAHRNLQTKS